VVLATLASAPNWQGLCGERPNNDIGWRLVAPFGGPGALSPLKSGEVTLDLAAGSYVLACFIASPDGAPHLAKGMLKPLSEHGQQSELPLLSADRRSLAAEAEGGAAAYAGAAAEQRSS
jgi:hypothetical protein